MIYFGEISSVIIVNKIQLYSSFNAESTPEGGCGYTDAVCVFFYVFLFEINNPTTKYMAWVKWIFIKNPPENIIYPSTYSITEGVRLAPLGKRRWLYTLTRSKKIVQTQDHVTPPHPIRRCPHLPLLLWNTAIPFVPFRVHTSVLELSSVSFFNVFFFSLIRIAPFRTFSVWCACKIDGSGGCAGNVEESEFFTESDGFSNGKNLQLFASREKMIRRNVDLVLAGLLVFGAVTMLERLPTVRSRMDDIEVDATE